MTATDKIIINFELDKTYLRECFDQSRGAQQRPFWQLYGKAFLLLLIAGFIIQLEVEGLSRHLGAFFIILAIIEIFSQIYARGWWVTRQMLSRNYGHKLELTMTKEEISWQGGKQTLRYVWKQVTAAEQTSLGVVLNTDDGARHYLSKSHFDDTSWQFLMDRLGINESV
ncbi:hypothetical protein [Thalassotalea litorea]|uniref:hypothetical protein n=1 Tax=Thalassotalea litorea TaxID=2020715 RepID=UPI00373503FF